MVQSKEETERKAKEIADELMRSWNNPPPKTEEEKWAKALEKKKFLNDFDECYVCGGGPGDFNLIKHHVRYFPEQIIAYVHYKCHKEIHDGKHPELIQYDRQESEKFYYYKNKKTDTFS